MLKIRVHGRVQGVGFRYEAEKKAKSLGLTGFARNERDHTLYIEAQGEREYLEKFLHWCTHHGPPGARITRVESKYSNDLENYQAFEIVFDHERHPLFGR